MKGLKRQSGVVLFFALILLIVMTVIGVALALNSGQSLRMAGAGSERIEAKAIADGGLAAVISNTSAATFATISGSEDPTHYLGGSQTLTPLPVSSATSQNVSCQRTAAASGTNLISCRRIEISNSVQYGRDNMGTIEVRQGIEQEVLNGSGS
ncbi:pilus assembly PilX N-terminal domain-containing protein [Shewanella sp. A32]|uniref:pilus assembly PilX family protein n=1 Tax=Shewanella sp. A32 TaxID=3031327 RepID=UPI0023B8C08F|nr:pilus assembly PilX N-terminal domain-containing protein [Shewanella sp. A32]MDF0534461.1 pilus assembly PilX N-terminal domain-containing protein [Shewanella sp. A32]